MTGLKYEITESELKLLLSTATLMQDSGKELLKAIGAHDSTVTVFTSTATGMKKLLHTIKQRGSVYNHDTDKS